MKIINTKHISIYFFISMLIYIIAVYLNATYYLPQGFVEWSDNINWVRQVSLIPDVTIKEIKQIIPLQGLSILGIFYLIMIFFSSFLRKNLPNSILFLVFVSLILILNYHFLDVISIFEVLINGGFDGEYLGEGWPELHAHGILLICVLLTIYLYYKESKQS